MHPAVPKFLVLLLIRREIFTFRGTFSDQLYFAGDTLSVSGNSETYLAKINKSGQELWARKVSGSASLSSVDVYQSEQLYMSGMASGTVSFDSITIQQPTNSDISYFLAAYDPNGKVRWVNAIKTRTWSYLLQLKANQQTGSACLAGNFGIDPLVVGSNTLVPDINGSDVFIAEYEINGSLEWLGHVSGSGHEYASVMDISPDGGIIMGGQFHREVVIDNRQAFSIHPNSKMFVSKWSADRTLAWLGSADGDADQFIRDMLVDSLGQIFTTGSVSGGSAFLGPVSLTPPMSFFIARMDDSTFTPPGANRLLNGQIWGETDLNCVKDSGEWDLAQWVIVAEPGPYYTASRPDGSYTLGLDTGTYTISALTPAHASYVKEAVCPPAGDFLYRSDRHLCLRYLRI